MSTKLRLGRTFLAVCFSILFQQITWALNETEPNASLAAANLTFQDTITTGSIGYGLDANDYFITYPRDDGTLRLVYTYSGGGATDDFFVYVYNKTGSLIGNDYNYDVGVGPITDTLTVYCRQQDSLYFRISSNGAFNYNLQYAILPSGLRDQEPNDNLNSANTFQSTDTARGRIGYNAVTADQNDYFLTVLPEDGTLKYYVEYNNTSGVTTSDFFSYIYNKNGSLIGNSYRYDQPLGVSYDTITVFCRAQDTIFFRLGSNGCFSYEFHYEVLPPTQNDSEPNNSLAEAVLFNAIDTAHGRIGYSSIGTDNDDYFITSLPTFGTFTVYNRFNNTSGSTTSDLFTYVYNKSGGLIGNSYRYDQPLGQGIDSITVHCRDVDTIYIRVGSNGCFSYHLNYEVFAPNPNDQEPNGNLNSASYFNPQDTVDGRVGYTSVATDNDDYFISYLTDDGTLIYIVNYINTSGSTTSDFFSYVYNKSGGLIGNSYQYDKALGAHIDTIEIACRASDTVYFRVGSNGCFSYRFRYEVIPSGQNDQEPNNSFSEAEILASNDTARGRIGYKSVLTDNNDYFLTVTPEDGTLRYYVKYINTSGATTSDFLSYIYNKNGGLIGNSYRYDQSLGISHDTVIINCRAADTVYFRIGSNGCFSYELSYDIIPSGNADQEPNGSFLEAIPISFETLDSGRIGYTSISTDKNDYFKIYSDRYRNFTIPIDYNNVSGSTTSDFLMYLYNSSGGLVGNKYLYDQPLGVQRDTLKVNCLPADTFYLRISSNGCFSYNFLINLKDEQPLANAVVTRLGNTFAFKAQTTNADSFVWDFDDGTTSSLRYPKREFAIGTYDVTLTATNNQCNLSDVDSHYVEVKGVEYFSPNKGGSGGDVMMQIFGGGLDTATKVTLVGNGETLTPIAKYGNPRRDELQVLLDLHFAEEGMYDVIIEIPGEPAITFTDAFEVTAFEYPFTYSEVIGPSRWRINRDTRFTLSVGNRGNVKATGVVAFLIWPKSVDVRFDTEWFRPPSSGTYTLDAVDSVFTLEWADIQMYYDSINVLPTPIDSFAGEAYDGYMKVIWIQNVAPGSTYEIPFIAKASGSGNPSFTTYTSKPNLFGSGSNGSWGDASENLAVEFIDGIDVALGAAKMDKTPIGWLAKATKATTKHMANLGQVMGATYNYANGTTNSIYESLPADFNANVSAGNAQIGKEILGLGIDKFVDVGADRLLKGQSDKLNKWLANNPGAKAPSVWLAKGQLTDIAAIRQYAKDGYKSAKDLNSLKGKLTRLYDLSKGCPDLQKQIKDLEKEIDKEMQQREKRKKDTRTVVSMDPNAIYGPSGTGLQQYVNLEDFHHFMVTYENVDTATADAQTVNVQVQLDTMVFDMSTFEFGDISIGKELYRVPKGRQEFTLDIDLYPSKQMIVRVLAGLDKEKGIINWDFISLDTLTGDLPLLDGFLPPNVNAPDGEGSMQYSIKLKSMVGDGTITQSLAEIVFDDNEPIITNTWENIVDTEPSSSAAEAVRIGQDSIVISFNGSDAQSGVDFYYLYVSEDGVTWESLTGSTEDTIGLKGEAGKIYQFYSLSTDRVGNVEQKDPLVETTVSLEISESLFNPHFILYPNPSSGEVFVRSNGSFPNTEVQVSDAFGKQIMKERRSFFTGTDERFDISRLKNGAYILRFTTPSGREAAYKLIVAKQ